LVENDGWGRGVLGEETNGKQQEDQETERMGFTHVRWLMQAKIELLEIYQIFRKLKYMD
jgi:hypothetical protein